VEIRLERPEDFEQIDAVVGAAFGGRVEVELVCLIRASEHYLPELAFVATDDNGNVVGHTMLSYTELEGSRNVLQLSPIAVAPARQRQGVGSALVRHALAAADQRGEPLVVLVGDPRYYGRFGFRPSSEVGVLPPVNELDAPWQVATLSAHNESVRGRIRLPRAFDEAQSSK
jgi:putative acetyltransferase